MRVGLVRNVALGMVALVGLGLAGCDDNPTDFDTDETVKITTNPTVMTLPAGVTALLSSRTENAGNEPTWEEISATVDGSCGSGALAIDVAASYEPTLQPPGQFDVTGGNTWGESCIQLSGGGVDATIEVMVVADSLDITGAPETGELVVFQTVQLSAALLSDDGSAVGPFDPVTDLAWSSDDETVLTVDGTGLVTAVGAGAATITATWTEFGVNVSASTTITVVVPPPSLTSTDVASAQALELVTITGTGMIPGAHVVLIDGLEVPAFYEPTVVNATTATVLVPGGAAADLAITVGVTGSESNALTVSRTCGTTDESCATEPGNDTAAGAPDLGLLPVSFSGYVDGTDSNDLLELTLLVETTFTINLDWTGNSGDLDVVFTTTGATDFSEAECGFVTATGSQPETGQCTLPAGTYFLWVASYDLELAFYQLDLTP
jgi:hypothetical protein